jgi:hypothetical protein
VDGLVPDFMEAAVTAAKFCPQNAPDRLIPEFCISVYPYNTMCELITQTINRTIAG